MEGAVVRGTPDPSTGQSVYDPPLLFHHAREAAQSGRSDEARRLYERFLTEFPASVLAPDARFNLALLHERAKEFGRAADLYRTIVASPAPPPGEPRRTWIDAHYRLAICQGQLGDWWSSVAAFDRALELSDLTAYDRLEALVGRAVAMQEAGDIGAAEVAFAQALRFAREAGERERLEDGGLVAEAALRMGDIASTQFAAVALGLPQEALTERLETKCELLLSAQSRYFQAMHYGDSHTVAIAGWRIGSLYESLYESIATVETPAELDAEQAEVYRDEVRKRTGVLLKKALTVYERSLAVGRRAPSAEPWVARLEQAVARLRSIFLAEGDTWHTDTRP